MAESFLSALLLELKPQLLMYTHTVLTDDDTARHDTVYSA